MSNKAVKATINYGGIELEVYQLPSGDYTLSRTQVTEAIEVKRGHRTFAEFVQGKSPEALSIKGLTVAEISIGEGCLSIKATPLKMALAYWTYWAGKGNTKAQALLMAGTEETLTRLADSAFGVVRTEVEYQQATKENVEMNTQILAMFNTLLTQNNEMLHKHNQVLLKLEAHEQELAFLRPIAERTEKMQKALEFLPEIEQLLKDISEDFKNNPNQEYKTLKQWLDELSLPNLGAGTNRAMGRMVADFFKIGKLEKPTGSKNKYPEAFVPVIEKVYQFILFGN